jgi:hypothetical protein
MRVAKLDPDFKVNKNYVATAALLALLADLHLLEFGVPLDLWRKLQLLIIVCPKS